MPFVDTSHYGSIFYLERGLGRPLVAIHGAGGIAKHWGEQFTGLGAAAHLYAPDLPGHGRSRGPTHTTIGEAAARVGEWRAAAGIGPAVIMGHSMGGAIAQLLALEAREWVQGLILIGTGARLRVAPQILTGLEAQPAATAALIVGQCWGPLTPQDRLVRATAQLQGEDPTVVLNDYAACDTFDITDRIGDITVPVLLIVGEQDRMTPVKLSRWLNDHLPSSHLVVVPDAGHMVMLEAPAAVNAAIRSWLPHFHPQ